MGLTTTHFIFAWINYINSINLGIITFIYVYLKIEKNGKLLKIKENERMYVEMKFGNTFVKMFF